MPVLFVNGDYDQMNNINGNHMGDPCARPARTLLLPICPELIGYRLNVRLNSSWQYMLGFRARISWRKRHEGPSMEQSTRIERPVQPKATKDWPRRAPRCRRHREDARSASDASCIEMLSSPPKQALM